MVAGSQYLPDDLLPASEHHDQVVEFLALAHGDEEDGKRVLLLLAEEEDEFEFSADDVAAVTQAPPIASFQ